MAIKIECSEREGVDYPFMAWIRADSEASELVQSVFKARAWIVESGIPSSSVGGMFWFKTDDDRMMFILAVSGL